LKKTSHIFRYIFQNLNNLNFITHMHMKNLYQLKV